VAFTPGVVPHLVTSPAAAVEPPPVDAAGAAPVDALLLFFLLPHALSVTARPTARTTTSAADHVLPLTSLNAPPSLDQTTARHASRRAGKARSYHSLFAVCK
jgi:hypothetical protein